MWFSYKCIKISLEYFDFYQYYLNSWLIKNIYLYFYIIILLEKCHENNFQLQKYMHNCFEA